MNAAVYEMAPDIPAKLRARGDEILGHGLTNSDEQGHLAEDRERALIAEATAAIERHEGARPVGWMSPWLSNSAVTMDLLQEAGYRYVMDWTMDDQPVWLRTRKGRILSIPYPIEVNDTRGVIWYHHTAQEFADMITDQFDEMLAQSARQPLVCPISLHPFVFGRPYRIRRLRRALQHILGHGDRVQEDPMKIGVVLPQTEIGNDPGAIKAYAEAVEEMGFTHILVFDHVLGANPERPGGWKGPYTYRHAFHEPFVLFGFLAAATRRVGLVTGIIILPQRQTALVAKQAAAVDVLSGGRLRLGVGVGWNPVEFEALGEDFHTRGRRVEEQVEVMRALWTKELITFAGQHHRITDAGLNPLPVQRPIPVWMGGESEVVQRRMARVADGWMPHFRPGAASQEIVDRMHGMIREAGRDPKAFGIEGRMTLSQIPPAEWGKELQGWQAMKGVTHLCVNTGGMGLKTPADHVQTLRRFREAVGLK